MTRKRKKASSDWKLFLALLAGLVLFTLVFRAQRNQQLSDVVDSPITLAIPSAP